MSLGGRFRTAAALVAAGALMLVAPAAAAANDLYVSKVGSSDANPCSQAQPCLTIQHAVSIAANDDTIHVAHGIYQEAVAAATKRLNFVGSGAGGLIGFDPSDTAIAPTSADPALRMQAGGSVRSLRLVGHDPPPGATQPGLFLSALGAGAPLSYSVADVVALGGTDGTIGSAGISIDDAGTGRQIDAAVDSSQAAIRQGTTGILAKGANVTAHITGTTIQSTVGNTFGLGANVVGARVTLERSQILDSLGIFAGLTLSGTSPQITVDHSTVRVRARALDVNPQAGNGTATVIDSLLANLRAVPSAGSGVYVTSGGSGVTGSLIARGSTIVVRGPDATAAIQLNGYFNPGSPATASVTNSVLRATDTDASPSDVDVYAAPDAGGVTFTAASSSFSDFFVAPGSGPVSITPPGSGDNLAGDPQFTDESAFDWSLRPSSPLIDRGNPAAVAPGELDLAGQPRSLDGNGDCVAVPDMGAFEKTGLAVACPAAPASPSASVGADQGTAAAAAADLLAADVQGFGLERRRFAVGRDPTAVAARRRTPRGSAFRYTISEDASARILIERAAKGLRSGRRCAKPTAKLRRRHAKRCTRYTPAGTLTRSAKQGTNRHPFSGRIGRRALKPGRFRATITTTDAAGNVSAPHTTAFSVTRR
jgi:hypothetical protein